MTVSGGSHDPSSDLAPVAVICGGGKLAVEAVVAAKDTGRRVVTVAIRDEADPSIETHDPTWLGWGNIGKLAALLEREQCRDVVMIGSVTRRPDIVDIVGDLGTMRRLPKIVSSMVGGDDSVLTKIIGLFETEGYRIIGAHEIAPGLLADEGPLVGMPPDTRQKADLDLACRAVASLGALDIGQAAVVVSGRVIAVEAAEGTDAMLMRCADVRARGRVKGQGGVLVKCAKPGQDLRVDLPTIGPETVTAAAKAGLSGIGIEAGRVLIAQRRETERLAVQSKIGLWGIRLPGTGDGSHG